MSLELAQVEIQVYGSFPFQIMIIEALWSIFRANLIVLTFLRVRIIFENLLEHLGTFSENAHELKVSLTMLRNPLKFIHGLSRNSLAKGWTI